MVKELLQANAPIFAVVVFAYAVRFSVVIDQPGGFAQAAQGNKEFDTLIPGYCAIFVVVQDEQRRLNFVCPEDG